MQSVGPEPKVLAFIAAQRLEGFATKLESVGELAGGGSRHSAMVRAVLLWESMWRIAGNPG
jgi:hypothetical protein